MSNLNIGGQIEFESIGEGAKQVLLDLFYPVNTLYLTDDENFNPNSAWGGTWEQLDGGYALMTTKKNYPYEWSNAAMDFIPNMNKEKVYEMSTHHADSHIPGTNVEGGLPNITGNITRNGSSGDYGMLWREQNNYQIKSSGGIVATRVYGGTVAGGNASVGGYELSLDASKCATAYGLYQKAAGRGGSVIPDHHATIVWKRIA